MILAKIEATLSNNYCETNRILRFSYKEILKTNNMCIKAKGTITLQSVLP